MIEPVNNINMSKTGIGKTPSNKSALQESPFITRYADSFVKHSVDSAPVLSGLTLVWSVLDKSRGIPFKKALSNNIKNFFLPVMLVTSAITALLENRKMNKKEN